MPETDTTPLANILQALTGLNPTHASNDTELDEFRVDDVSVYVTGVTANSRDVRPGVLFVAVQGAIADGHKYIPRALDAGAAAIIGTHSRDDLVAFGIAIPDAIPYGVVDDARLALAQAAAAFYYHPSRELIVIGVTGTDGKTTTCMLIESILVEATRSTDYPNGRVGVITTVGARILGEEQQTGFHVTTPDAPDVQRYLAQMRDAGCVYAVVESTSHGLAQCRVAAVDYDVAAVTNITHEHLDYHGTRDAYVQAKSLLFRALYQQPADSGLGRFAVLNHDDVGSYDVLVQAMCEESHQRQLVVPIVEYSANAQSDGFVLDDYIVFDDSVDVAAADIGYNPAMTTFELLWQSVRIPIETSLIGQFNVQNILCAATVALGLDIEPSIVQRGVKKLAGIVGRMERIDHGQSFLAIVDFAHSPVSLERALQTLRPLVTEDETGRSGRLIAIFGCAGLRDRQKRRLMGDVSGRLADYTIVTAEDPRTEDLAEINHEIESGLQRHVNADRYTIVPDRSEAILHAVRIAKAGDVVVAFGKGHERSMCFGTTEYPWSDQEAMENALDARGHLAGTG